MHRTHLPKSCVFVAGCFGVKDPDIGFFFKNFNNQGSTLLCLLVFVFSASLYILSILWIKVFMVKCV